MSKAEMARQAAKSVWKRPTQKQVKESQKCVKSVINVHGADQENWEIVHRAKQNAES